VRQDPDRLETQLMTVTAMLEQAVAELRTAINNVRNNTPTTGGPDSDRSKERTDG
jgi:signal transduction histidine kinase